jgi:hypothetical protein
MIFVKRADAVALVIAALAVKDLRDDLFLLKLGDDLLIKE